MKCLGASPVADHEVAGVVLGVDDCPVQADGAPAGVGHLGLVPGRDRGEWMSGGQEFRQVLSGMKLGTRGKG